MAERPLSDHLQAADITTLQEILREAEAYLNAQLTAAIAADQRAYTFAGLVSAAAVVVLGGAFSVSFSSEPLAIPAMAMVIVGAVLIGAAAMAAHSARAVDFAFAGNQPAHWAEDVLQKKPLLNSLAEQCQHYDEMIVDNTSIMNSNSDLFNFAVRLALTDLMIGAVSVVLWIEISALKL